MIETIQVLQHVPFEGPAAIARWAQARNVALASNRVFEGDPLPDPVATQALLVLGGPMGVHDEHSHPWLLPEKRYIEAVLTQERPVIGICLGAQLLAHLLGAHVGRGRHAEIGWHDVHFHPQARAHQLFADFPEKASVVHWHGDTFQCPSNTIPVGHSEACPHQGFFDPDGRILGLQFHPEWDAETARRLTEQCADELESDSPYVQTPEQILRPDAAFEAAQGLAFRLLDRVFTA